MKLSETTYQVKDILGMRLGLIGEQGLVNPINRCIGGTQPANDLAILEKFVLRCAREESIIDGDHSLATRPRWSATPALRFAGDLTFVVVLGLADIVFIAIARFFVQVGLVVITITENVGGTEPGWRRILRR
jgi:hypothetical protein